ncbi:MAG: hypothetical protein MJ202_05340 [Lentisphaeria bacterium]|nr:hypothetical protein [Lentisphaeria bacterium]
MQIYKNGRLTESGESLDGVVLADGGGYDMFVLGGGAAWNVVVGGGCALTVQDGGHVGNFTVCSGDSGHGSVSAYDGFLSNAEIDGTVRLYNATVLDGAAVTVDGALYMYAGSSAYGLTVAGGYVYANGCLLEGVEILPGGRMELSGGTARDVAVAGGTMVSRTPGEIANCRLTEDAVCRFGNGTKLSGTVSVEGRCAGLFGADLSDASLDFLLAGRMPQEPALLDEWKADCAPGKVRILVQEHQASGNYRLAERADGFDSELAISICADGGGATDGDGVSATTDARYDFALADGGLVLTVANRQDMRILRDGVVAACSGLWTAGPAVHVYSRTDEASVTTRDFFAEDYAPAQIAHETVHDGPARIAAAGDGLPAVFLAEPSGKWDADFLAFNTHTGESISIQGKNRFSDVFAGQPSADAVLVLTDGDDAVFAEDVYSGWERLAESRIQNVTAIYAGGGDDIVDLTCRDFNEDGVPCLLHGGDGDDVLWGGSAAAVFVGGDGDDVLVSRRDDAVFVFDGKWGNDTVEVGEGCRVTLWFAEGDARFWDAEKLCYSADGNFVRLQGEVAACDVTLKFGGDVGQYARSLGLEARPV